MAGDTVAQISLAESLVATGDGEHAASWLRKAADGGDVYATALLGVWEIIAYNVEADAEGGLRRLEYAAASGESAACAVLAYLHAAGLAVPQDWNRSLDWLTAAARLENARALTQLGLLAAPDAPAGMKITLWWAAATRGFHPAQQLLGQALSASGDARSQEVGAAWLGTAARAGNPCALAETTANPPMVKNGPPLAIESVDFEQVRSSVSVGSYLATPAFVVVRDSPRLVTSETFIPADACDYLAGLSAPYLQPARVNTADGGGAVPHGMRTNSYMQFELTNSDPVLALVDHRIGLLTGAPAGNQESTAVLRYRPGETYADHFDFIDPDIPHFREELAERGQRVATALIYLNDGYTGGATAFPALGISYRGRRGDAIAFRNVDADGRPDRRMLHTGRPPGSGEKWLLSKWIRDRTQLGKVW